MLLGKTILIVGPPATGKTLLAKHLQRLLESLGGAVVLHDDVGEEFKISLARLEPEGTTSIITSNFSKPFWEAGADVVLKLRSQAFTEELIEAYRLNSAQEGELHA